MGQRLHLHGGGHTGTFHRIGFHKLHAGRGVEEQVTDDDGGTIGAAGFRFFHNIACFQTETDAFNGRGGLGQQVNTADRRNGGQSFTTETAGGNGGQILCGAKLRCGMAQEGGAGIFLAHTAAVVGDTQEGHAAVTDLDGDLGGTGVHRVFQQFLGNGRGTFHHLAGGDQIGNMGG